MLLLLRALTFIVMLVMPGGLILLSALWILRKTRAKRDLDFTHGRRRVPPTRRPAPTLELAPVVSQRPYRS